MDCLCYIIVVLYPTICSFIPASKYHELFVCFAAGVILWYSLLRGGYEIFRDPVALNYADDNAILPYQTYHYRIQACNSAGCIESSEVAKTVIFVLLLLLLIHG